MKRAAVAIAFVAGFACVSPELRSVPECPALSSLPALPDPGCEIGEFSEAVSDRVVPLAGRALVRIELDNAARIHSLCLQSHPDNMDARARRELFRNLSAITALPPGPRCAAGRRLDLNRYQAALADMDYAAQRCSARVVIQPQFDWIDQGHDQDVEHRGNRETKRCMEREARSILLEVSDTTGPWVYVKPEISDPAGPSARETANCCAVSATHFEERAACIEADGWERLEPPPKR